MILIEHNGFNDERGSFTENYEIDTFARHGITGRFVEFDTSVSKKGVLRGMHFQREPYMQGKLVRCVAGEVFDVSVDIRKGSPTFGKYVSARLSGKANQSLFIPRGFAHGFLVLSDDDAVILYCMDNKYSEDHQDGIMWNDPDVKIDWPVKPAIISKKDTQLKRLRNLKQ